MPTAKEAQSTNWGDEAEIDDPRLEEDPTYLPERRELGPDDNGIKKIIEYRLNDENKRVKVTTTVKVEKKQVKVNRNVLRRREMPKFGACRNVPKGQNEQGVTSSGDPVTLDLTPKKKQEKKEDDPNAKSSVLKCRICGMTGDHWTLKCPFKDKNPELDAARPAGAPAEAGDDGAPRSSLDALASRMASGGSASGKYVPPSLRGGRPGSGVSMDRDEQPTLRVTNLSDEVRESDLGDLFSAYGKISRIYLAKDKITGYAKGYAFVTFFHHSDAEKALNRLHGFGFQHLILNVEWARPSNKN
eukprot:TRINITY_DN513_c0_g1_i2.p1 TRINITY_DN513_c0_g1~~TRINITY_DN513_c0_g1_i2.p1  ORF type:complete len:301 (-),score=104.89 TRINITY_DN513_c0_g1_i2:313-1215(-)